MQCSSQLLHTLRFARVRTLALGGAMLFVCTTPSRAQFINQYFQSGVPGYEREPGVTVASRLRPAYDPPGVRLGAFTLEPKLREGVGYNSNAAGLPNSPGSWFLQTAPSITLNSNWSRDRLGAAFTLEDGRYFDAPSQNYTDWTAMIGGGHMIGRHEAILAYSHLSLHEDPSQIGSALSSTPIPYQVDDLRGEYTFERGRFSFIPRLDIQHYQFGDATVFGTSVSESSQNRVVLTGGVETRYALSDQRSLVFVIQGIDSSYTDTPPGQPTNSSESLLALTGLDYQASGVWRYRVLLGVERRMFAASRFSTHTAPIAEASVIWTPTGLTTVTGLLSRTIEDPAAAGTGSYTYTRARLVVDHEYRRNVLLQGRVGFESAEYLSGGGTQTNFLVGAGVKWLLNRNVRLSLDYTYTDQRGAGSATGTARTPAFATLQGSFVRNLVLFSMRIAL